MRKLKLCNCCCWEVSRESYESKRGKRRLPLLSFEYVFIIGRSFAFSA